MTTIVASAPDLGQLVEVRRRKWIVSDIEASALRSTGTSRGAQHLVALTSVEDDAFDESIQVVWELEPGARIIAASGLPDPTGFDPLVSGLQQPKHLLDEPRLVAEDPGCPAGLAEVGAWEASGQQVRFGQQLEGADVFGEPNFGEASTEDAARSEIVLAEHDRVDSGAPEP